MNPGRIAIAATTFACAALLSFGWSGQRGVSLSVETAQAAPAKAQQASKAPQASKASHASRHVAAAPRGHMPRHVARSYARGYGPNGYGPNPVRAGADVAVGTAGAVAAGAIGTAGAIAAAPFGAGPYAAAPAGYYSTSTWGDFDCRPGYAGCQPYSSKDWNRR